MDYAGSNTVAAQDGIERLASWARVQRKFIDAQEVQPKGKIGRADMALNLINKLDGIESDHQDSGDLERHAVRQQRACRSWNRSRLGWTRPNRKSPRKMPWARR